MKIVFFVILSFLAVVGISHIVFEIYYRITKFNDDCTAMLIIPKIGKSKDVEFTVRSIISKLRKLNDLEIKNVVCISDDLNEYTKKELGLLQNDFENLYVLTKQEFIEKVGS